MPEEPETEAEPVEAPAEPAEKTIEEKLEARVSFHFVGSSFTDVIEYISRVSGTNIVIDPEIAPELEAVPITLKLTDVTVQAALNTLARIAGDKKVEIQDEIVWITNG